MFVVRARKRIPFSLLAKLTVTEYTEEFHYTSLIQHIQVIIKN